MKKYFGERVRAVDDVSLTIEPGSLVTLLGPSGSGKTTILRAIAGFEDITDGAILIDGESIARVPTYRRQLGMVAQDYALFPHMTVRDNLEFGIRSSRRARRERVRLTNSQITARVDEMLEVVGLDGFQDRRPQQLSGGQKQRVALARALVTQPRVLLLDEPFAALDKHLREQLQVEVRRVQQQVGTTTVFVTHDQGEALSMSDRIAVLNAGKVEQFDAPTRIYESPATRFVAGFIGKTNFFAGELIDKGGGQLKVRLTDETEVLVRGETEARSGEQVQFAVRPERLVLSKTEGKRKDGVSQISGVVHQVVYLGDRREMVIASRLGEIICNSTSGNDSNSSGSPEAGDQVAVTFPPEAVTLLPGKPEQK